MTLAQLLQGIARNYASLRIADLQLARARQETAKAESSLGWNLSAQGRLAREVSAFGIPTDVYSAKAGLSRKFASGGSLALSGNQSREDATSVFLSSLPNPVDSTGLDLSYRQPLQRGRDNPDFVLGKASAEAGVEVAEIERSRLRDSVGEQASSLFYLAARTLARLENARQSIQRARKLRDYIRGNLDLGVAEEKDVLQVRAQIDAREADYRGLKVLWEQQRNQLNRLLQRPADSGIEPRLDTSRVTKSNDVLQRLSLAHSPDRREAEARLRELDAVVEARRDAARDQLDLVYSTGMRRRAGDAGSEHVDDNELVAGVAVEYGKSLDRRGLDADLYQARLDQATQRLRLAETDTDLNYEIQGYVGRITAARTAVAAYRKSREAEKAKLDNATRRYRDGRENTDRLIQFETEYRAAELNYQLQRIDLAELISGLKLMTGQLWAGVEFAEADLPPPLPKD